MTPTEARDLLESHGLTVKMLIEAKMPSTFTFSRDTGLQYNETTVNQFIQNHYFPVIDGEMFTDWS